MTIFTKSAVAAGIAVSLVACIKQDDAPTELKTAIPTADQVKINLPQSTSRAVGDPAAYYKATRDVTRMFNGGSEWVLILVHTIVQYPVTSVSGDTYTWGPWSDALDPAEYKLDVTALGDGTYDYQLSGRSKLTAGAAFEVVIDGSADPRKGDRLGSGKFLLDFDAGRRVNPIDAGKDRGTVTATYDLAARHLGLDISTVDDKNVPVLASYAYNETADHAGDMVFNIKGDAGRGAALEEITLRSRWLATGAGRADARFSGGDCNGLTVTASECWDTHFGRRFYQDSVTFAPTEGNAADCVFAMPDLPPQ